MAVRATKLFDLPTEIHFEILKHAIEPVRECGLYFEDEDDSDGDPGERWHDENISEILVESWMESDISRSPYNYAFAFPLWFSVLKRIPKHWDEVIIDVSSDPQRFLDIFSWSKGLHKLTVVIVNTRTPDSTDVNYSALERERVAAVFEALRPNIHRCRYIRFEVVFATSLPSPVKFLLQDAPHLTELTLECRIDNIGLPEEYSRICDLGVRQTMNSCAAFPLLQFLSMTGFWFMYIAHHQHTSQWFLKLRNNIAQKDLDLSISQFDFQNKGHYTLRNFLSFVCLDFKPAKLKLRDLSLSADDEAHTNNAQIQRDDELLNCDGPIQELCLQDLSADFIEVLNALAFIVLEKLFVVNCTLPDVPLPWDPPELTLVAIPNSPNYGLMSWAGYKLYIKSCPSFDDTTLSILGITADYSPEFQILLIRDCSNFTVHALQQLIERRNQMWVDGVPESIEGCRPVKYLIVDGDCPFPTDDEQEWFNTSPFARPIKIDWYLPNPEDPDDDAWKCFEKAADLERLPVGKRLADDEQIKNQNTNDSEQGLDHGLDGELA